MIVNASFASNTCDETVITLSCGALATKVSLQSLLIIDVKI